MKVRAGVTTTIFAVTSVLLLIVAGIGFGLFLTQSAAGSTTTLTVTPTMSSAETASQLTPATGQMIHSGWVVIQPTGSGQYALSVYAQGLEDTQSMHSVYIVEGAQSSGSMAVVPIGPNSTASEFETNAMGQGSYFVLLNQNPYSQFENIQLIYLPGMSMTNATVVATATLTMMSH